MTTNAALPVVHLGGGILLAADASARLLRRSEDGGASWKEVAFAPANRIVGMAGTQEGIAFVLAEDGRRWSSRNAGTSWEPQTEVVEVRDGTVADFLVTDLGTPTVAIRSRNSVSVFRVTPLGTTRERTADLVGCEWARFLRVGNGILLIASDGRVLKSHDDVSSWILQASIGAVARASEYIGTAYLLQSTLNGQILRSGDQGWTWEQIACLPGRASSFNNLAPGIVLCAVDGAIWLSSDYGRTWRKAGANEGLPSEVRIEYLVSWITDARVGILAVGRDGSVWRTETSRQRLYEESRRVNHRDDASVTSENPLFRSALVGLLRAPGVFDEPEDVLVGTTHAYIPSRDGNNVAIVDIRDPRMPTITATIRHPDMLDVFGIEKHGDILYVTSLTNHTLLIFDVRNPKSPRKLSSLQVGGRGSRYARLTKVVYHDAHLYLTHRSEGALYVVDVRDPTAPRVVGRTNTVEGAFAVAVDRGYAYVGGCYPGHAVAVVDISDPQAPRVVRTLEDAKSFACMCSFQVVGEALVAVAYASSALLVFDISDPPNMRLRSSLRENGIDGPNRLVVADRTAFVINAADDSLLRIDLSDLNRPRVTGLWADMLLEKVYGIGAAHGKLLLVARDAENLLVVDPARLMAF